MIFEYDRIKTLLINYCGGSNNKENQEIELEIKFGNINHYQFNRLLQYMTSKQDVSLSQTDGNIVNKEISTILFQEDKKKTMILNEDGSESINWEEKICVDTIYNTDFNVSMVIIKKTLVDRPKVFESVFSRDKIKYSYKLKLDNVECIIELTEVMEKNKKKIESKYECEVKYKQVSMVENLTSNNILNLNNFLFTLLSILNNTNIVYTEYQKMKLITDCNKLLGDNISNALNITTPLTINTLKNDILDNNKTFVVSTKAKGLRKMLIIHDTGIWLVNPPYEYNLIIAVSDNNLPFINSWNTSIFDGQLIQPINSNQYEFNYKYWYLCYDCIMFKKINIQQDIYYNRIDKVKALQILIKQYIEEDFFNISLKTTRSYNSSEQFYTNIRYLLTLSKTLNYEHNGLIFVSSDGYKSTSYKWIVPTKITIDFTIYDTVYPNILKLYVYDKILKKDVEFKGNGKYPFDVSMILQQSLTYINDGKKKIVECKWDNILHKMIGIGLREDKLFPNTIQDALHIWDIINEPLNSNDISGKSLTLMYYYFKNIIKNLLVSVLNNPEIVRNSTDVLNNPEIVRNSTDVLNNPDVLTTTGYDKKNILNITGNNPLASKLYPYEYDKLMINRSVDQKNGGKIKKVDIICLFLSLSYYWRDESSLDALVKIINNNLNDNGSIIFFTLDGITVTQLFMTHKPVPQQINIDNNELSLDLKNRTININENTEYLVNMHDLTVKLNKYGIHLVKQHRADKDKSLPREILLLSSLYSYGIYKKV